MRDAYSEKFSLLTRALEEILEGRASAARRSLAGLTRRLEVDSVPEDMQFFLFAAALARRLGVGEAARMNLYLRRFELPQIALFNLVAERLPMVGRAGDIANELLCRQLARYEEATLVDIGPGTGRQEVALLRSLDAGAALRRLTVVAVEPDESSLRQVEVALQATARERGLTLRFLGIPKIVEALDEDDWALIADNPAPRLVHAAFALHHMGAGVDREALFHRLRALEARAVVLCEPHSDHHTDALGPRFHNVWNHFSLNFDLVDALDLTPRERNGIKLFFGRELEDILGVVDDSQRYERHERVETWLGRLRAAGFDVEGRPEGSWSSPHPGVHLRPEPGYVSVGYRNQLQVAVIHATAGADT